MSDNVYIEGSPIAFQNVNSAQVRGDGTIVYELVVHGTREMHSVPCRSLGIGQMLRFDSILRELYDREPMRPIELELLAEMRYIEVVIALRNKDNNSTLLENQFQRAFVENPTDATRFAAHPDQVEARVVTHVRDTSILTASMTRLGRDLDAHKVRHYL